MKKKVCLIFAFCVLSFTLSFAQKNWNYINKENVSFKIPDGWRIENTTKKQGPMTIRAYDPNSTMFMEIRTERFKQNLKVRANDIATLRSAQQNFEYMEIDKVRKADFNRHDAQLLTYTNTYLNDVSRGEIYTFIHEGYTYSVEVYGEDKPEVRSVLNNIASTVNVNAAEKKENKEDMNNRFVRENWSDQEMDHSAEIAEKEAKDAAEKAEKQRVKARELDLKAKKNAEKEAKAEQKRLEKQQMRLAARQQKIQRRELAEQKRLSLAAEKQVKIDRRNREIEMGYDGLVKRKKNLEKELTQMAQKQLQLSQEYGQAEIKKDKKKMEKIQKEQAKLSEKVTKLQQEKDAVLKQIEEI